MDVGMANGYGCDVIVKMFLFFIFRFGTRPPYIFGRNEKKIGKQRKTTKQI